MSLYSNKQSNLKQCEKYGQFWKANNYTDYQAATQCNLTFELNKWCSRDFCYIHGRHQREVDCCKVLALGSPLIQANIFVGKINYICPSKLASAIRKKFFSLIKYRTQMFEFVWRWEFVHYEPHLNCTIFLYTNRQNNNISQLWETALKHAGHPQPNLPRTYYQPCDNYEKWTNYMFKPYKNLGPKDAPLRNMGDHWSYWGISKGYSKKCDGISLVNTSVTP